MSFITVCVCIVLVGTSLIVITEILPAIKSDPLFLLWKGLLYVVHKGLLLQAHPQHCLMRPEYANARTALRFSIVQVFDRPVGNNLNSSLSWWDLSSAICATYARRHGYGYVFTHVIPMTTDPSLLFRRRNRTMHWARIPVLMWLLKQQPDVDWWLYLDMDAMIRFAPVAP